MTTRGITWLTEKRIPHSVIAYDHLEKGAAFAAQQVGFPLEQTVKTLVVMIDTQAAFLALMPGDRQLSLKKAAAAAGGKKAAMADTATAQRLTGYMVGGISPFGTKKQMPVIMHRSIEQFDQIMINAGQRGIMVKLDPTDLHQSLNAAMADLVQQ